MDSFESAGELWAALDPTLRRSLDHFCADLRYRYSLVAACRLGPGREALGVEVDSAGQVVSCGDALRRYLEEADVGAQDFMHAQPILVSINYNDTDVPCGPLGYSVVPALVTFLAEKASKADIEVRLSFESRSLALPSLPFGLATQGGEGFGFDFKALPGTGLVVTSAQPGLPFFEALQKANPQARDAEGVLIDCVGGLKVSRDEPQESFTNIVSKFLVQFARSRTLPPQNSEMQKKQSRLYLTVRFPVHINTRAPPPIYLLRDAYKEILKVSLLVSPDFHKEVLSGLQNGVSNAAVSARRFNAALEAQAKERASALKMDASVVTESPNLFRLACEMILGTGEAKDGSIASSLEENGCRSIREVLRLHVRSRERYVKASMGRRSSNQSRAAKTEQFIKNSVIDQQLVQSSEGKLTLSYLGDGVDALWDAKTQYDCPVCKDQVVSAEHSHSTKELKSFVYMSIFNVDSSKCPPISHFLSRVGWQHWELAELVVPLHLHPERAPLLNSHGTADVRVRAVMRPEQVARFMTAAADLSAVLQRHFKYDFTGEVVRQRWTAEVNELKRKREH